MNKLLVGAFVGTVALLVACGGGGSPGPSINPVTNPPSSTAPPGPTACPSGYTGTAPNCVAPQSATNASGVLVDDPSGNPLAGEPVKLEPWGPGPPCTGTPSLTTYGQDGCPTPLPSPQVTTAPNGDFTLGGVPNGHYLLVIGSDSPTDSTRPTIHDNVTLTGGYQQLQAPTLPPIPTITPPAVETNGDYRLVTIDPVAEAPCLADFNAARASLNLPPVVEDEWPAENQREFNAYHVTTGYHPAPYPNNPYGILSTGDAGAGATAPGDCSELAGINGPMFTGKYPPPLPQFGVDSQTQWFAGSVIPYPPGPFFGGFSGGAEFPIDPRDYVDANVPLWP